MRFATVLVLLLGGCFHVADEPTGDPPLPAECEGRCIVSEPINGFEDCCDSVTCYQDPENGEWQVVFCDPPPPNPCDSCTADEMCVAKYDGTCGGGAACVPKTVECPDNACTTECQDAYCGSDPYQCEIRSPCGTEPEGAFTCYGP